LDRKTIGDGLLRLSDVAVAPVAIKSDPAINFSALIKSKACPFVKPGKVFEIATKIKQP
jgi:hypothetical protein